MNEFSYVFTKFSMHTTYLINCLTEFPSLLAVLNLRWNTWLISSIFLHISVTIGISEVEYLADFNSSFEEACRWWRTHWVCPVKNWLSKSLYWLCFSVNIFAAVKMHVTWNCICCFRAHVHLVIFKSYSSKGIHLFLSCSYWTFSKLLGTQFLFCFKSLSAFPSILSYTLLVQWNAGLMLCLLYHVPIESCSTQCWTIY